MVVIGIIGILSSIVVPFVEKCYKDIQKYKAFDRIDMIISASRANYLIFNEPVLNTGFWQTVDEKLSYFLPSEVLSKHRESNQYHVRYMQPGYSLGRFLIPERKLPGEWDWLWAGTWFSVELAFVDQKEKEIFYKQELKTKYTKKGFMVTEDLDGWSKLFHATALIFPEATFDSSKVQCCAALEFYYR